MIVYSRLKEKAQEALNGILFMFSYLNGKKRKRKRGIESRQVQKMGINLPIQFLCCGKGKCEKNSYAE